MEIIGTNLITGFPETMRIANGKAEILEESASTGPVPHCYVSPGWFDLQVNGFAGINLSVDDLTPEHVVEVTRSLAKEGITTWLPTLISGPYERTINGIRAIVRARKISPLYRDAIAGIHLEGPYISHLDGFRGAHDHHFIRKPDWQEFSRWQEAAEGLIRIITVAPEIPGAIEFIRQVTPTVVVGMSHSNAAPEDIYAAVDAGATFATHLGNGIAAQIHRHRNPIWAQLADERVFAGVIFDGFHLPPPVMQVFYRVKGKDKLILTSDAVHLARMAPGVYGTTVGGKAELHPSGKLTMYGSDEYLAGSASSLKDCIETAVRSAGCSLRDAVVMASATPQRLLHSGPASGKTVFTWDSSTMSITVLATIEGHVVTYLRPEIETFLNKGD